MLDDVVRAQLRAAQRIATELGDVDGLGWASNMLASCNADAGRLEEALAADLEGAEASRRLGSIWQFHLTGGAAWFTDSVQAKLYRVPINADGSVGAFSTLTVTGPAGTTAAAFNMNGIAATPDGKTLFVAHSGNGAVYTVDAARSWASAVGVRDGRIVYVGTDSVPAGLIGRAWLVGLAAVSIGVAISFGMLDIVNIAHPAFIILGSYIAYIVNTTYGIDPVAIADSFAGDPVLGELIAQLRKPLAWHPPPAGPGALDERVELLVDRGPHLAGQARADGLAARLRGLSCRFVWTWSHSSWVTIEVVPVFWTGG